MSLKHTLVLHRQCHFVRLQVAVRVVTGRHCCQYHTENIGDLFCQEVRDCQPKQKTSEISHNQRCFRQIIFQHSKLYNVLNLHVLHYIIWRRKCVTTNKRLGKMGTLGRSFGCGCRRVSLLWATKIDSDITYIRITVAHSKKTAQSP